MARELIQSPLRGAWVHCCALAMVLLLGVGAGPAAAQPVLLDADVEQPLTGISFAADGTGFMVGNAGTIVRVAPDRTFEMLASGTTNDLLDVYAGAPGLAVASGIDVVLLWDGSSWQPIAQSSNDTIYTGLWITPEQDLVLYGILGGFSVVCPYVPGAPQQSFCRSFVAPMVGACGRSGDIKLVLDTGDIFHVDNGLGGEATPLFDHPGSVGLTGVWMPPQACAEGPITPREMMAIAGFSRIWQFDGEAWSDTGAPIPMDHVLTGIDGYSRDQVLVSGYVDDGGTREAVIWSFDGSSWSEEPGVPAGAPGALDVGMQAVPVTSRVFGDGFEPGGPPDGVFDVLGLLLHGLLPTESSGSVIDVERTPVNLSDVEVDKLLLTAGPVREGDEIEFQVVVFNYGPDDASGLRLTDRYVMDDLQYVSDDCGMTAVAGPSGALELQIAALPAGGSVTCVVRFTVLQPAPGEILNQVDVTTGSPDVDYRNNDDSEAITISP